MSVLKAHRSESKAEFVNVANKIYIQTIGFLSRLSSRYSRLVSKSVAELASEVVDHAEMLAYFESYDDHNRVLRLRRLFYSIFGFSPERIENFRERGQKDEIRCA